MEELLYNLSDNAIRYNRLGGKVQVIIGKENGFPVLIVKDTGIGIPKESQERVFERFYRVDKSRFPSRQAERASDWQSLRHIVAQHHAKLRLRSEVGVGTEVSVTFSNEKEAAAKSERNLLWERQLLFLLKIKTYDSLS